MKPRAFLARFAALILGAVVVLVVLGVLVGVLAYGTGAKRAGELEVDGLAAPVTVGWPADGAPVIAATDEAGLFTGLGYVHASDNAWSMALWRQAALGELAAWFPVRTGLDRHARALGFAASARRTYDALPADERALLDAYAAGVNAALAIPGVAQRDEFVLLDVRPAPWQPWHALAVERMLAWLATPPLAQDSAFARAARADTGLVRFAAADSTFRAYLRLGGFHHARAFTGHLAGDAPFVAVVQPWGSSALALFQEVVLDLGGRRTLAATVPGTLALPFGQDDARAWSVLLTAARSFGPDAGEPPPPVFDRLVDRAGNETLLTFLRAPEGLYLPAAPLPAPARPVVARPDSARPPPDSAAAQPPADSAARRPPPRDATARPDTTVRVAAPRATPAPPARRGWRLRWAGFGDVTDLGAWRALLRGGAPAFRLFRGTGLVVSRSGGAAVMGQPVVRREVPGGVFISEAVEATPAAARLEAVLASARPPRTPLALLDDAASPWAAARLPGLVAALGDRAEVPDSLRDAYAFLRGWDARYDPDAIGASLFELWLLTHRMATGDLPSAAPDSLEGLVLRRTLGLTLARMRRAYGPEAADWRWGRVQPGTLRFPVWAAGDADGAAERYAPAEPEMGGHPTALRLGPGYVLDAGATPGVWEAWTTAAGWDRTAVRHPGIETRGFLARARTTGRVPDPLALRRDAAPERVLTLVPPPARGGQRSDSGG